MISSAGSTDRSGPDGEVARPRRCRIAGGDRRAAPPQVPQGHYAEHASAACPQPGHDQPVLGQRADAASAVLHHRYVRQCSRRFWIFLTATTTTSYLSPSIYCHSLSLFICFCTPVSLKLLNTSTTSYPLNQLLTVSLLSFVILKK